MHISLSCIICQHSIDYLSKMVTCDHIMSSLSSHIYLYSYHTYFVVLETI